MKQTVLFPVFLAFWAWLNQPHSAQAWNGVITGVSFNPMRQHHDPAQNLFPSQEEIEQDLALLQNKVHAVRTYSVSNGFDVIPELAGQYGLNVSLGAWIGENALANQQEIDKLIALSRANHANIVRTLVGNEALLRKDVSVEQLIAYIRQVKRQTWRPVSTSETWDTWLKYPELADEVDFIAAHILPYWEGVSADQALDYVFQRYYQLQQAFPDKPVVITVVGWPSNGKPIKQAQASLVNQARFLRAFFNRAHTENITYYTIEAFDQPWKMTEEGSAGAYWGLFDAERQPKFAMQGMVENLPQWPIWAFTAISLGLLVSLLFLTSRQGLQLPGILFFGLIVNLAASMLAWTAALGVHQYQTLFNAMLWGLLLLMQALAILVLLVESLELVEVLWSRSGKRQFRPITPPTDFHYPKVSLHVPIHNEPPEMVAQTLAALKQLDYPNLEVLVIDNNTSDPDIWRPVEQHCQRLGPRFRFFHLENWPGYKAGALNYALTQTAEDAEIIAVIDSDYQVSRNWLRKMTPHFANPQVGFVQSPQNYHDWRQSLFKTFCQWEYAGFFHIGMVQRNEHNAIIQHGTMTMIRKSALEAVGQWGEWCICEDSELGLRLYKAGYDSVYAPDTFGKGLTPDSFSGYIGQRNRWVYGAMQILKRHAKSLFKHGTTDLTAAQRYHFISGWLPWFSDALALVFTLSSLILTGMALIAPEHSELPVIAFILPVLGLFVFKLLRSFWLYQHRVRCGFWHTLGATLAGMALTHTVAIAIWQGLFTSGRPFLRTPKCEQERPFFAGLMTIRQELLLLVSLWAAAFLLSQQMSYDNLSGHLWIAVLLVQSLPYLTTLLIFMINSAPVLLTFPNRYRFNTKRMQEAE